MALRPAGPGRGARARARRSVRRDARTAGAATYRFSVLPRANEPVAALAVPVRDDGGRAGDGGARHCIRLRLVEAVFDARSARTSAQVFLVDRDGELLWSEGASASVQRALARSDLVRDFAQKPLSLTAEYDLRDRARPVPRCSGMVSPVVESGWGVVVHKPVAAAFESARRMVSGRCWRPLLAAPPGGAVRALRVALARRSRSASSPRRAHEIAAGNFGERLPERAVRRRARRPVGRLQPHGAATSRTTSRELKEAAQPEPRAVHQLDPRLRRGDRRQGPLHARPLRARRRALADHRHVARPERGVPAEALDRRRCCTTSARSASRTGCSRRAAC